jgi:class 3 adenylate cyclase
MRIGIHTGDAIGGITGTNVVRYDIYGKDVMIANKMESNGVPGKVAVSQATKDLLEENTNGSFGFEFLKDVKAWGETVKSYILIGN